MKKQSQWGKIQTEAPWQPEELMQPKMQKGLEGSRKPEEEKWEQMLLKMEKAARNSSWEDTLDEEIARISGADHQIMTDTWNRWDTLCKPLRSFGKLEEAVVRVAGIQGTIQPDISRPAVVIMGADNGVVEEGVSQSGSEVTAQVLENMGAGISAVCILARQFGAPVYPVNIGMKTEGKHPRIRNCRVRPGTGNIAVEPAMTREEGAKAILTGISVMKELKEEGYNLVITGEMGIGNTTTSSAMAAVFLHRSVSEVTGYGAGLSGEGLRRKIAVIERALKINRPDAADPLDVLTKVGGLDIAGLTGLFLGGARYQIPVLIDGFISSVAACCAWKLCPAARDAMIATHCSGEPAGKWMLEALGLEPFLYADMRMGEGTGAAVAYPVLQAGFAEYTQLPTFAGGSVKAYEHLR